MKIIINRTIIAKQLRSSVIHLHNDRQCELVYVLTTSKTQQKYTEVIRLLKNHASNLVLL